MQTEHATSVWAVVNRFGGVEVTQGLNGAGIHQIGNVMTLAVHVHLKFDRLHIWFEETVCYVVNSAYEITDCPNQDIPNTYRVCGVKGLTKGLPSSHIYKY
jgi:hypothetical protein